MGPDPSPRGLITAQNPYIPVDSTDPNFRETFENYLIDVAGRYAFIIAPNITKAAPESAPNEQADA